MSEWWTYRLSDFLLFSPQTYFRLFALHNEALWPWQIAAFAAGIALLVSAIRGGRRIALLIAGTAWLLVAWLWFLLRYATINWAAEWLAAFFVLQALLLCFAALRPPLGQAKALARRTGLALIAFALAVPPSLPLLLGRDWQQGEVFALAPGPTVIATLGLLLALRAPWLLFPLPLLWCGIDGATLWTMKAPEAWLLPACGMLAVILRLPGRSGQ